jgi:hypothetical protein
MVPDRLRREKVHGTRKAEREGGPQYQTGWEGRRSTVPERLRDDGIRERLRDDGVPEKLRVEEARGTRNTRCLYT